MKSDNKKETKSLTSMIWLYFVALAIIIFIILWFMQVVFLQVYYSSMKKSQTVQIGKEIEEAFNNALDYKDQIDTIAYRNSASIYILSLDGEIFYTNTSYASTTFSQIQEGILAQMPGRTVSIDVSDVVDMIVQSSSGKVEYTLNVEKLKSEIYVYGKIIADTDYCYVIIISIDPIDATTSVITSQLIYITIFSLIISTIIALFMSKKVSRPIIEMNNTAKKLEKGDYSVKFEKCGYRELDQLADTLNSATQYIAKNDEIKRELVANVSHDLKTPLTMIKAYSEMIRDLSGDNKKKREEHIKVIIDETDRLTRLVNDMMDLSKIESGEITLSKEVFNFSEVAKSIIERIKLSNIDSEHEIIYTIPNDLYVNADITKIEQVLYNLVVNAIKHSGEGKRTINVKVTASQKRVKVEVIDNGVGISKEDLKHIWDRYYKASESFTRQVQGSGLGLSIVKNILLKHSSDFGVESELGKGSNFWFDLERVSKKEVKKDTNLKQNTKEQEN